MCGIAGWVDVRRDLPLAAFEDMVRSMRRRGPDGTGTWSQPGVLLGHRRLAVIDLESGAQPMEEPLGDDHRCVITFCGEIYNHGSLRVELSGHGHSFRTSSDTEVILKAYLQWGDACLERLVGMFAFAIWNSRSGELLLARDRLGIKPLYYFLDASGIIFGSEQKVITSSPGFSASVDDFGLSEILDMTKSPGCGVFDGIAEVEPGQYLKFSERGITRRRYWSLEARPHTDDLPTTITRVRDLLEETVSDHLAADVPIAALLSGGLDSSAVAAIATSSLGRPLDTYSLDLEADDTAFVPDAVRSTVDRPYAKAMAEFVGAHHREVVIAGSALNDARVRNAVLRANDTPPAFWGDMWQSLYLLFARVRATSTVVLSGEGADELFGGYRWFHNPNAVEGDTFPWLTSGSARYFGGTGLLDQEILDKIDIPGKRAEKYSQALREVPRLAGESAAAARMREISYLNLTRFVRTLLDRKDRMSMAVGLEARVPFCDHRLVEYVFNAPWDFKHFDGREKSLLRAAARDLLPESVTERVKTPYPATVNPAYEARLQHMLHRMLGDPESPVLPIVNLEKAKRFANRSIGAVSRPYDRGSIEMVLWLDQWMREFDVALRI